MNIAVDPRSRHAGFLGYLVGRDLDVAVSNVPLMSGPCKHISGGPPCPGRTACRCRTTRLLPLSHKGRREDDAARLTGKPNHTQMARSRARHWGNEMQMKNGRLAVLAASLMAVTSSASAAPA